MRKLVHDRAEYYADDFVKWSVNKKRQANKWIRMEFSTLDGVHGVLTHQQRHVQQDHSFTEDYTQDLHTAHGRAHFLKGPMG